MSSVMSQRDTALEIKEEVSVLQGCARTQAALNLSLGSSRIPGLVCYNVTLVCSQCDTGVLQGRQLLASLVTMLSTKFTRTVQPDQQQQTICNKSLNALSF